MAPETTAILKPQLRHRSHALDGKTHTTHSINLASGSVTSSDSAKDFSFASDLEEKEEKEAEKERRRRPVLVEDDSDTEDEAGEYLLFAHDDDERKVSDSRKAAPQAAPPPPKDPSRAWYEFDLAVVVALVSPIGNWLTGGDHIKNVFLIMLLVFYLHQIIESAMFLRYATAAVIGEESVSWFSTALFVLATGMRPWSHVIERLRQRTADLHDVIHYPSLKDISSEDMGVQMAEVLKRVEHLERGLSKAKARLVDTTEEVYDYVEEAVTIVDRAVKRHEKKYEKQELKVREMEEALDGLKGKGKHRAGSGSLTIRTTPAPPSLLSRFIPTWMFPEQLPSHRLASSPASYSPSPKHSLRSFPSSSSIQLQSIPEEETAKYPVLAQPANITALILSRVGYVATIPLRAVFRMIFRRY
ncbi:hypothetical protein H0H87_003286 [Tephrocybe sp. NHM501043]|nr:hypothetical protein H0H87_003286 [Tephrocybe sp. NHM501043]